MRAKENTDSTRSFSNRQIAIIEAKEREALFRNTAAKMGISEAVIEKDFFQVESLSLEPVIMKIKKIVFSLI